MLTDWLIVRRLAGELDGLLRGRRIRKVGVFPDGRLGVQTDAGIVAFDPFAPTPLVTLEGDARLSRADGWVRTAAGLLEGLRIDSVRARPGDRVLVFDCSARSRFGVSTGYRLVAELVPRYGNLVLLKGETVVASAKSFRAGEGARRTVTAGEIYEPPPLRADAERTLPRLVAQSLELERARGGSCVGELVDRLLSFAGAGSEATADETAAAEATPVYVYYENGRLVQAHVVPLLQFEGETRRVARLLPVLSENAEDERAGQSSQALGSRRASLAKRIGRRRDALAVERETLQRELRDAETRDRLRLAGDLLYAHLPQVPARASRFTSPEDRSLTIELDPNLDAKANAALFFKRYKKAATRSSHLQRRLESSDAQQRYFDELSWALDEACDRESIVELEEELDRSERRRAQRSPQARGRRRYLEVELAPDARLLVGRSPQSNADLTFRVARPDDLWFHARNVPGAHVVLRIDGKREPTAAELESAAALAAFHSRARDAQKVDVDYTERKHVRKQRGAAPGLVWYTDARTLSVAPKDASGSKDGSDS